MSEEMMEGPGGAAAPQGGASPNQPMVAEVHVDDSGALPSYTNFARVMATTEEVIVDFGLNPNPYAPGRQDVKASQRIVMNFFTAKRLLQALHMTIARHEQFFGTIELDVNRRRMATTGGSVQPGGPRIAPTE
ncbi:hypothetical protein Isop_3405 [Isosphaera pallida ATCC 43644]|jgi:hypothetical protein|uniref:DUF3467 domain-containing protein n=1 Tax=Isosphaera pallida (strain ATCC 43644 / DSM 9630 / IS1B) TaxID=575540 RepID=E8R6R2_ISOPI|nr:DUF3467 domain-containing protein [Isosphaera pallida]ADV63964.1 hypothetical protein Isop_3405 [Isosphaera pallida ATCC 43644]